MIGQTLTQLKSDMKGVTDVDFVTDSREFESLKQYKNFEELWWKFRFEGGNPNKIGVIVARGLNENKEGFIKFFILQKDTVDRLGNLWNKKQKDWSSADRAFCIDDKPEDKIPNVNLIDVDPTSKLHKTENPNVFIDTSFLVV